MKKYTLSAGFDHTIFEENPQGEWVKWEDVQAEIEIDKSLAIVKTIEAYEMQIKELKAKIGQECNCEEMYEQVKYAYADGSEASWFCPAHGYKRR